MNQNTHSSKLNMPRRGVLSIVSILKLCFLIGISGCSFNSDMSNGQTPNSPQGGGSVDFVSVPQDSPVFIYYTNEKIAAYKVGTRSSANQFCREQAIIKKKSSPLTCQNYFAFIALKSEGTFLSAARAQGVPEKGSIYALHSSAKLAHPNFADFVKYSEDMYKGQILTSTQSSDADIDARNNTFKFSSQDLGSSVPVTFMTGLYYQRTWYVDPATGTQDYTKSVISQTHGEVACKNWTFNSDPADPQLAFTDNMVGMGSISNGSSQYMSGWGRSTSLCVEPSGIVSPYNVLCSCW